MHNDEHLRYPIGRFAPKEQYTPAERAAMLEKMASLPAAIESLVRNFSALQFNTAYRNGGWTARQVIHHIADSHMNAYIRIKWTLTEASPVIKAYDEGAWAETPEVALDPVISLNLLKALHVKMVALLTRVSDADLQKVFTHPETQKQISLERMIGLYSWHGEHHLGHLKIIAEKA